MECLQSSRSQPLLMVTLTVPRQPRLPAPDLARLPGHINLGGRVRFNRDELNYRTLN